MRTKVWATIAPDAEIAEIRKKWPNFIKIFKFRPESFCKSYIHCLCICPSVCLSFCVCLFFMSLCMYRRHVQNVSTFFVHLSVCLPAFLNFCTVCLSVYLYISVRLLSVCLYVYLYLWFSIHPSVCMPEFLPTGIPALLPYCHPYCFPPILSVFLPLLPACLPDCPASCIPGYLSACCLPEKQPNSIQLVNISKSVCLPVFLCLTVFMSICLYMYICTSFFL